VNYKDHKHAELANQLVDEGSGLPFKLAQLVLGSSDMQAIEAVVETFNVVLRNKRDWFFAHNRVLISVSAIVRS
jgi:hypothetical protein